LIFEINVKDFFNQEKYSKKFHDEWKKLLKELKEQHKMELFQRISTLQDIKEEIKSLGIQSQSLFSFLHRHESKIGSIGDLKSFLSNLKYLQNDITIYIHGSTNVGKSTFINAILQEDLVPSAPENCTARICEIIYGEKRQFKLGNGDFIDINGDNLSKHIYVVGEDRYELENEFKSEKVTITIDHELLKLGVKIIDNPGFESKLYDKKCDEKYENQSLFTRYLEEAQIIILLFTNELLPSQFEYFNKYKEKTMYVINKVDDLKNVNTVVENQKIRLKVLNNYLAEIPADNRTICGISAKKALDFNNNNILFTNFLDKFVTFLEQQRTLKLISTSKNLLSIQQTALDCFFHLAEKKKPKEMFNFLSETGVNLKNEFIEIITGKMDEFCKVKESYSSDVFKKKILGIIKNSENNYIEMSTEKSIQSMGNIIISEINEGMKEKCKDILLDITHKFLMSLKSNNSSIFPIIWGSLVRDIEMNYDLVVNPKINLAWYESLFSILKYSFNFLSKKDATNVFIDDYVDNVFKKLQKPRFLFDEFKNALMDNFETTVVPRVGRFQQFLGVQQDLSEVIKKDDLQLLEIKTASLFYILSYGYPSKRYKINPRENIYATVWNGKKVVMKKIKTNEIQTSTQTLVTINYFFDTDKTFAVGSSPESTTSYFSNELYYTRKLIHENIIQCEGIIYNNNNEIWLMLEHLECDLVEYINNYNVTDLQRINICLGISNGLEALHQHTLIHKDIKPSNILVSLSNDKIICKINDLGIANLLHENGKIGGTMDFMAPESLNKQIYSEKSDVFSLGKTFSFIFKDSQKKDLISHFVEKMTHHHSYERITLHQVIIELKKLKINFE
jgi:GTP-binding protein EngB required for normal cell division/tRNA A-37 threonylcarbamoyl transferase component Bud32